MASDAARPSSSRCSTSNATSALEMELQAATGVVSSENLKHAALLPPRLSPRAIALAREARWWVLCAVLCSELTRCYKRSRRTPLCRDSTRCLSRALRMWRGLRVDTGLWATLDVRARVRNVVFSQRVPPRLVGS